LSIEKRLLRLADSFADEVSRADARRFRIRVQAALGLGEPAGTPQTVEGASAAAGPRGGGREGEAEDQSGVRRPGCAGVDNAEEAK